MIRTFKAKLTGSYILGLYLARLLYACVTFTKKKNPESIYKYLVLVCPKESKLMQLHTSYRGT